MAHPSTYGPGQSPWSHPEVSLSLTSPWVHLLSILGYASNSCFSLLTHCPCSGPNQLPVEYWPWVLASGWALVPPPPIVDSMVFLSLKFCIHLIYKEAIHAQDSTFKEYEECGKGWVPSRPVPKSHRCPSRDPYSWQLPPKAGSACNMKPLSLPVPTSVAAPYYVLPCPLLLLLSPSLYCLLHDRPINR